MCIYIYIYTCIYIYIYIYVGRGGAPPAMLGMFRKIRETGLPVSLAPEGINKTYNSND